MAIVGKPTTSTTGFCANVVGVDPAAEAFYVPISPEVVSKFPSRAMSGFPQPLFSPIVLRGVLQPVPLRSAKPQFAMQSGSPR
mmetsp:Transcript_2512/g.3691  ORF Transcript_2512/g.3691 Transcript_2512/m.3691 type:complete len:83 (+) Transcript_2512:783-1031(+)